MMFNDTKPIYYVVSVVLHLVVLLLFVVSLDFVAPLRVVENTNQHDVISAVVLGETAKSKVVPQKPVPVPQEEKIVKPEPKPLPKVEPKPEPKPIPQPEPKAEPKQAVKPLPLPPPVKKDAISLKPPPKKVVMPPDLFGKNLLADLKQQTAKQKKLKEKQLSSNMQKLLKAQAEKSLRQQLLDEDIKVKGTETRLSQGIIDKYTALIQQAVREEWVFPQEDKKLSVKLRIRVAPGGMVLDVQVAKSSGDPALDSSARAAVFKASPLQVPKEAEAFEKFRQFEMTMRPLESVKRDGVIG